jgi:hypothetical protein
MAGRLTAVILVALALTGTAASGVLVDDSPPSRVPVLAQTFVGAHPDAVPPGMMVVFLPPAGDGFPDGGDGPGGKEWVIGLGFSDGGDVPEGFIAVGAQPVGDAFWRDGYVPDGVIPVLAWHTPDGFSDGGDLPEGYVPVLFRLFEERAPLQ